MSVVIDRELSPADIRALRQLAAEVRLLIITATMNPSRLRPYIADAIRHTSLLVDLTRVVLVDAAHKDVRSLPLWIRIELLGSRGRRRVWRHRAAHLDAAQKLLGRFEAMARRLESRLWDG